nr:hypothetical protein [Tanacetum cinerariifolium]
MYKTPASLKVRLTLLMTLRKQLMYLKSLNLLRKKVRSKRTKSVVIHDTPSVPKPKPATSKLKLKGVQSLTPEEQESIDTMQALKESMKTSRRQPDTRGSSEGTSRIPGVLDEYIIVSASSSKGTGTKSGVPDEEKVTSEENVILD